jgi:2-keto-4-pentenoate hydratase
MQRRDRAARRLALIILLTGAAATLRAEPGPEAAAIAWRAGRPMTPPLVHDLSEAVAFQEAFVAALAPDGGARAGYKAALTNPAAQQRFGVNHPLLGVLLANMLLPDGAEWSMAAAAVPLAEADLLVRVHDARINEAQTDRELVGALDAAIPFIELADGLFPAGVQPDAPALTALNAGARAGVLGGVIPLPDDADASLARLGALRVVLRDESGQLWGEGHAQALLGHPVEAVRWIRDEVRARGHVLKPGDLLSLGSLTPPRPIRSPTRLTAVYEGLDDQPREVHCRIIGTTTDVRP